MAIERKELVSRHNPILKEIDVKCPLSVGNGEFAFTADFTGLQTFYEKYRPYTPLCTQSQWGWHSFSNSELENKELKYEEFDTYGRSVGYPTDETGQKELFDHLRHNAHRLNLGRIALDIRTDEGEPIGLEGITHIHQELDLWRAILKSNFRVNNILVATEVCVHPVYDALAVKVQSALATDLCSLQ
ncbi:MAG TPA: hypothetical protein VFD57_04860 [Clostridia bacterium]|nr:hypothetical protein [Clostridia bacterium]